MRRFDRGPCPSWQPSGARRGAQMRLCVREKNHACLARRPLLSGGSGAHRGPALLRVVWPALRFSNPPRPGSNPPGVASSFGVDGSLCLRIGLANTDECGQVDLQRRVLAVLRNQTSRWRTTSRAEASRSTSASGAPPPPGIKLPDSTQSAVRTAFCSTQRHLGARLVRLGALRRRWGWTGAVHAGHRRAWIRGFCT